jgi:hypothetical protein
LLLQYSTKIAEEIQRKEVGRLLSNEHERNKEDEKKEDMPLQE